MQSRAYSRLHGGPPLLPNDTHGLVGQTSSAAQMQHQFLDGTLFFISLAHGRSKAYIVGDCGRQPNFKVRFLSAQSPMARH